MSDVSVTPADLHRLVVINSILMRYAFLPACTDCRSQLQVDRVLPSGQLHCCIQVVQGGPH
jgi:hypothetical protein